MLALGIYPSHFVWENYILFGAGSVLLVSDVKQACEGPQVAGQVTITDPALCFLYVTQSAIIYKKQVEQHAKHAD